MDPWDPDIDTAAEYAQEARLRGFEVDELAMRQSVPGYGSGEGGSSASEGDY
jgi:hypothetical protein